jgi:hypothetical protein
MNPTTRAVVAAASMAAAVNFAAPAYADPDTDFANQLHSYGIYGPRDTKAWFGKITCQRLNNHLDTDAYKSADFLAKNLPKGSTTGAGLAIPRRRDQHLPPGQHVRATGCGTTQLNLQPHIIGGHHDSPAPPLSDLCSCRDRGTGDGRRHRGVGRDRPC